jgi:hypothetical protein
MKAFLQGITCLVIHIAGKRIIYQGTNGWSRKEGIVNEEDTLSFILLHDRQENLAWFGTHATWLSPFQWYSDRHRMGQYVWTTPPDAGGATLEQLCQAVHKWPYSEHLVFILLAYDSTMEKTTWNIL